MSRRNIIFSNDEYYHVFNRGVARMPIFNTPGDYIRFLETVRFYKLESNNLRFSHRSLDKTGHLIPTTKIIDIISYCLMPNHFHLLIKQLQENGIANFMKKTTNSYAKYFNLKNDRVGPLLQGNFKAVHIETTEQLIHVSRYIHLNPVVSNLVIKPVDYKWSSYGEYVKLSNFKICDKDIVFQQFNEAYTYLQFVDDQIDYAKRLEGIKHLTLDT
jgi:putative transposase